MAEKEPQRSTEGLRQQAEQVEAIRGGRSVWTPNAPVVARPVRRYRAIMFQSYVISASIGFGLLFLLALRVPYSGFDLTVTRWIQHEHADWFSITMSAVSALGYYPLAAFVVALAIVFAYSIGLKWESVMLAVAAIGIRLLEIAVKLAAHRERPASNLVEVVRQISGYSFPSGHVLLFTGFFGFVVFLVYTLAPRSWARTLGLIVLGAVIALVGISRVYVGDHWPTDVIGAYLLGSLWLAVVIVLYRKGKRRFFVSQPLAAEKPRLSR